MKPTFIKLLENELPVQNNLSIRPSDMGRLTIDGQAIAAHQMDAYVVPPSDYLSPENRRGASLHGLWEQAISSKTKINNALNSCHV